MAEINRREAFTLAAAAAVSAAIPSIPFAAPAAAGAAAPLLPVWAVGEPGEFNWDMVRALTEDEAKAIWAEDRCGVCECECEDKQNPSGDCEFCCEVRAAEAQRYPQLDAKAEITPADWLRVGMGHICSRCSYETFREEGGHPVGNEAVCQDCMKLEDWDIADPERAAEIRAEMAEEDA